MRLILDSCVNDLEQAHSPVHDQRYSIREQQSNQILNWQMHLNKLKALEEQLLEKQHAIRLKQQTEEQTEYDMMKRTQTSMRDAHLQSYLRSQMKEEGVKRLIETRSYT